MLIKPLISVITVVYNDIENIEQTILSVLSQSDNNNIEYIIIDGKSDDGTLNVIKKYESKITCWISEHDDGIYDAMNKGILLAKGEWVNFMNSGDLLMGVPNLEKKIDIIAGSQLLRNNGKNSGIRHSNWRKGYGLPHQSTFIKRDLFLNVIGLYSLQYDYVSDFDFWLRCQNRKVEVKVSSKIYSEFNINGVSCQKKTFLIRKSERLLSMFRNGAPKKLQLLLIFQLIIGVLFPWVI